MGLYTGGLIDGWVYTRVGLYTGGFIHGWAYTRVAYTRVGLHTGGLIHGWAYTRAENDGSDCFLDLRKEKETSTEYFCKTQQICEKPVRLASKTCKTYKIVKTCQAKQKKVSASTNPTDRVLKRRLDTFFRLRVR